MITAGPHTHHTWFISATTIAELMMALPSALDNGWHTASQVTECELGYMIVLEMEE